MTINGSIAVRAAVIQGAAVAVLSIALAVALPKSFFQDWGWLAGPGAWMLCALLTASVLALPRGKAMLGAALHLGAGIAPDRVAAMAWLLRATRGGSDLARPFLTAVRASLTPAELSLALARSSEPLPPVSGGVA